MIDIHSHILPEVDDGSNNLEESVEMARQAVSQGITSIIATPHHKNGRYENYKTSIIERIKILNEALHSKNIPLTILPGQETRINGDMIDDLAKGELLTLNEQQYLFVELPTNHVPRYTKQLLFDLQVHGYVPVIVHPERNIRLLENPDILYEFVKNGTLTQITAASLIGKFGSKIERFTNQLVEANLTHFLASDAHNTTNRTFCIDEAIDYVNKHYGADMVYYFIDNSQVLVDGGTVMGDEPERVRRKKFLGLF